MRVLVQRVNKASVTVNDSVCGTIEKGLLLFLGVHQNDTPDKVLWLVNKIAHLRIFSDDEGKMNLSLKEIEGNALVVSQFTLYGNCGAGRRPDFIQAALPEMAFLLYEEFIGELSKELERPVASGIFGASMQVHLINDGPVTFLLEK